MENIRQGAILDFDAINNFLMINAHTTSIVPTDNPVSVTLPDGNKFSLRTNARWHYQTYLLRPEMNT